MILSTPFSRHNKSHQTWQQAHPLSTGPNTGQHQHGKQLQQNGYHKPQVDTNNNNTSNINSNTNGISNTRNVNHHQRSYSSASLRRPAPQQPAPDRPNGAAAMVANGITTNGTSSVSATGRNDFRSSTLNRLDLLKQRQKHLHEQQQQAQQQQHLHLPLRRNLSSLGHYPLAAQNKPNGLAAAAAANDLAKSNNLTARTQTPSSQIYAPASIASPRELAHYTNGNGFHRGQHQNQLSHHQQQQQQQQHYAATSLHGNQSNASFDMGGRSSRAGARSGRESALSGLIERFGTLKRKARRHWPPLSLASRSSSRQANGAGSASTGGGSIYASPATLNGRGQEPGGSGKTRPGTSADGEDIYGTAKVLGAEHIYAEGLRAIDGNSQRRLLEHELDPALMSEGETRTLIDDQSARQADYLELVRVLTNWINDELAEQRIIVRDLQDDLYDGQVLCKLIERLHNIKLDIVDVTQNELAQKYRLKTVLDTLNRILSLQARWARIRWTIEGIHGKNMVEIVHLLVTIALYYRAPIKMPPNVIVNVLVVQRHQNELIKRSHQAQLTDNLVATLDLNQTSSSQVQRDAFDSLLDCAPEKLALVEQSLVRFCNRHLNKINMSCNSSPAPAPVPATSDQFLNNPASSPNLPLDPNQFSDGLLLVFLISSLEDYFVPLGNLFTTIKQENKLSTCNYFRSTPTTAPPTLLPYIDTDSNNNNSSDYNHKAGNYLDQDARLGGQQAPINPIDQPTALEPTSYINTQPIEKLHNVNVALQLIEEAGIDIRQRVRAEDLVNGDLKAVLRVLYALFSRYKHL